VTSEHASAAAPSAEDAALAVPPDAQNPAIQDARKIFLLTVVLTVLFVGSVVAFIL
jgi:hypothetical protein